MGRVALDADPRIVGSYENNKRHIARARKFILRKKKEASK